MKRNKNTGSGFSRFIRYFRNEMTGKERNAFERELQKDPFAGEAAEGFSSTDPGHALNDLRLLEKKLAGKTNKRTAATLYRTAAAVAILLVISSVFLIIDRKSQIQTEITETARQPLEIAKADPVFRQEEPVYKNKDESPVSGRYGGLKNKKTAQVSDFSSTIDMAADSLPVVAEALEPEAIQRFRQKEEDVVLAPAPPNLKAAAAKGFPSITGTVISSDDSMPVPGAMVSVKGTTTSVLTNAEGKFEIPVTGDNPVTLVANFIGMSPLDIDAEPGTNVEVTMQPDAAVLSEVVVVGYGASRKSRIEDQEAHTSPEPVNGKKAFDDYIRDSIRRPDSATVGRRAVVVTSFKVLTDGSIDSIRIVKSPGEKFSEEAIRLLKSGPAWKPARQNGISVEDEVRLRIVFR